jgi:large subunit ribosomal protein L3
MGEVAVKFLIGRKRGMMQRFTEDGQIVPLTVVQAGPCYVTRLRTPEKDGLRSIQIGFEECRPKVLSRPRLGELGVKRGSADGGHGKRGGRAGEAKAGEPKAGEAKAGEAKAGEGKAGETRETKSGRRRESAAAEVPRLGKAMRHLREVRLPETSAMPQDAAVGDVVKATSFEKNDIVDVIGTSKGRGFMGTIRAHHFNRGPASHGSMNIRQPGSIGSSADPSHVFKGTRMAKHLGAARCTAKNLRVYDVDGERDLLYIRGAVAGPTGALVVVRRAMTPPPPPKAMPAVKKASQKGGPQKAAK